MYSETLDDELFIFLNCKSFYTINNVNDLVEFIKDKINPLGTDHKLDVINK
jgi:hypothetical protein